MSLKTVRVTIGRNVKDAPMSIVEWDMFQAYVINGVLDNARFNCGYEIHLGAGSWDGITEESAIISFFNLPETKTGWSEIHLGLFILKNTFHQDAIALDIVSTDMI